MVSIGSNDGIVPRHSSLHALGNAFLAIVQMAEASNHFCFVETIGLQLGSPHGDHVLEVAHELVLGGRGLRWHLGLFELVELENWLAFLLWVADQVLEVVGNRLAGEGAGLAGVGKKAVRTEWRAKLLQKTLLKHVVCEIFFLFFKIILIQRFIS